MSCDVWAVGYARPHLVEQALAHSTSEHLLGTPSNSIPGVADQIIGLHNTTQVSPYLSLNARVESFRRADLEALMWEEWKLVRFRAMRLTMFVFSRELLEIAAAATRSLGERLAARWLRDSGLSRPEFNRLCRAVLEALGDGPLTTRELRSALAVPQSVNLSGVVGRLCDLGQLVGGAPPVNWRSSVRRYHLWSDVIPEVDLQRWDESAAAVELIRRYVASYGPVTLSDIAWWTGFTKAHCRQALEEMPDELEKVAVEDWPGPLFLSRTADQSPGIDSTVIALPLLDPYVQGYRDRQRMLDAARFDYVYDGGGNSAPTLVRRGRIIGVWQPVEKPPSLRYHLFGPSRATRKVATKALEDVSRVYFDAPVDLNEIRSMKPLSGPAGARSAAHPLDGRLHRGTTRR